MRIVLQGIAIIAQRHQMIQYLVFFMQYLSTCVFVFSKNADKPSVCSHGRVNARSIFEDIVRYIFNFLHLFKFSNVIVCNIAPAAG
jgi:hypothetical protein